MSSRRHFIQRSAALLGLAAAAPLLPNFAFASEPSQLLRRKIPASGEMLPVIGMGTSRTFNVTPNEAGINPLDLVMRNFINGGATLIDTAPSYGTAEAVTGLLLKRIDTQRKAFLATKLSATSRDNGLAQFNSSLEKLQTDKVALLQVHNLQDTQTQMQLMGELKEQDKIRYTGITHYLESAHDDLLAALKKHKPDFVQLNYSIGERNAEKYLLPYCADNGIAVLVNRPFMRGQLLSKMKGQSLPGWAIDTDATSWAQLLLKFILANPAVTAVLPATSTPRYVTDNIKAGMGRLPDETLRERIIQAFS
ncbi:aldo/keto reductase [Pseudomonas sp. M30-35]|uniref:aldo/keto reductase n=1 Tax=Pseudomonas sp. M30-35 TaxID=1981174 RepID=UPI000B3D22E3|nr:aldo/keto reductase [Pseudomonas sp. M30-35]ARU90615.1 aldo/keto reductase [Pseudomonas sp. M30-35]